MILFQMSFSRKDAGKLALTVTIVSENLGSEIRKELRWAESFKNVKKVNVLPRTSVDILRVPQGVKRPRRKTIGLSLNQTIGAIAQDRQTGGRVAFDFNCRSTVRWKGEKAEEKEEAGDRSLQT